ncbi:MAG: hypothetical protein KIT02_02160 [Devosia sp.]|uniref:hypothetical protein n=1 Tax=Devosia sp. TaxID=1871048 RepID=UPI0024C86089|nr:hypothetical protein [Devosia sp.]UYO00059.1 MAG: hypothetical protein KIT02_02160 [Devosia sp.]
MTSKTDRSTPAPEETDPGEQKDDNIDDLGRKPDGSALDQPLDDEKDRPKGATKS